MQGIVDVKHAVHQLLAYYSAKRALIRFRCHNSAKCVLIRDIKHADLYAGMQAGRQTERQVNKQAGCRGICNQTVIL